MKAFIILALAVMVHAEIDWSKVISRDIYVEDGKFVRGGPQQRIIGGQEAIPHSYPYQVAILITILPRTYFCGGSLISETRVLTAAHCTEGANDTAIRVLLGRHNLTAVESTGQDIQSESYVIHPDWDSTRLRNDISIIKLAVNAVLNAYVAVISLPNLSDTDTTFANEQAVVTGWGKTSDNSTTISPVLKYLVLPVATNLECRVQYPTVIQPTHICTRNIPPIPGPKSTCNGDSGGPLVLTLTQVTQNIQIGIVSFGRPQCSLSVCSGFTRVSKFLTWIGDNSDVVINN